MQIQIQIQVAYALKMEMYRDVSNYSKTEKSAVVKKSEHMKLNTFEVAAFQELQEKFGK